MERFRATVRAGRAAQYFADSIPVDRDEGLSRGAWERRRTDQRPQAEPEPPLDDGPYSSYQQNRYNESQQQQQLAYSQPSSQFPASQAQQSPQQPYHATHGYPQNTGDYGVQTHSGGGHGNQYQGQLSTAPAGQTQYSQYPNQQVQGYASGPQYNPDNQGRYSSTQSQSVPQSQSMFPAPPLSRATTTGSCLSPAPPQYCATHWAPFTHGQCPQCPRWPY